jgi:hypothetical protein
VKQVTIRTTGAGKRPAELVSLREYARRRSISHVAVIRAIRSGRISTVGGKIDPKVADREWRENTDPSKPRSRITGRPNHRRRPGEPSTPMNLDGYGASDTTAAGYARARAARELYRAQLPKLELDCRRGILVRADEVRLGAFNVARKARDQLIALPGRMSARIAAAGDPVEIRRILKEEIERICREIVDTGPP